MNSFRWSGMIKQETESGNAIAEIWSDNLGKFLSRSGKYTAAASPGWNSQQRSARLHDFIARITGNIKSHEYLKIRLRLSGKSCSYIIILFLASLNALLIGPAKLSQLLPRAFKRPPPFFNLYLKNFPVRWNFALIIHRLRRAAAPRADNPIARSFYINQSHVRPPPFPIRLYYCLSTIRILPNF